jgi:hypothetical protein
VRLTRTGIAHAQAECLNCTFKVFTRNSLGLAAQHHDRTGHEVHAEQGLIVIYGGTPKEKKKGS